MSCNSEDLKSAVFVSLLQLRQIGHGSPHAPDKVVKNSVLILTLIDKYPGRKYVRTATPGRIEIAFSAKLASFPLDTQFSIPAKSVAAIFGPPMLRQDHNGALHRGP